MKIDQQNTYGLINIIRENTKVHLRGLASATASNKHVCPSHVKGRRKLPYLRTKLSDWCSYDTCHN